MSVHVFRSLPFHADSRTKRNGIVFESKNNDVNYYTWEKDKGINSNSFPFLKNGNKLEKIVKFFLFLFWVPFIVFSRAKKADVVVLMDLETALLGVLAAKVKGCYVIFDIVDPISQTKLTQFEKLGVNKYVDWLELRYAVLSDMALVPHECRINYYKERLGKDLPSINFHVVENVPSYKEKSTDNAKADSEIITIGYFGTLDYNSRGLEILVSLAKNHSDKIKVIVAGQGGMSSELEKLSTHIDNVEFKGSFNQETLVALYESIDYTWAFYSSDIPLHKYAAPNKFYEHLYFEKPIITTKVTPQSELIEKINSGVIIDDSIGSNFTEQYVLDKILAHHNKFDASEKAVISDYWQSKYHDYYSKIKLTIMNAM